MESTGSQLREAPSQETIFRQEGEYWTIAYGGIVRRLKDIKGLQHLAYLLLRPGVRVSAVELVAVARGAVSSDGEPRSGPSAERARLTVTKAIKAALGKICEQHPALGQHLSATIRRGYFCSYTPDPRYPIHWET
jgi:hypothetical protein